MKQQYVKLITILLALVGLIFVCRFLFRAMYPYAPCDMPRRTVTEDNVVGEWRAVYSQQGVSDPVAGTVAVISDTLYLVAPDGKLTSLAWCPASSPEDAWFTCSPELRGNTYFLNGEETLRFWENGTYQQIFVSETYTYTSPIYQWELVTTTTDSPKLKLYGGKYFPEGVAQAFSENDVFLSLQMSDLLRTSELEPRSSFVVTYPKDGFTELYPRICSGEFSLTQMVFELQDPDNMAVTNPVFVRSDD